MVYPIKVPFFALVPFPRLSNCRISQPSTVFGALRFDQTPRNNAKIRGMIEDLKIITFTCEVMKWIQQDVNSTCSICLDSYATLCCFWPNPWLTISADHSSHGAGPRSTAGSATGQKEAPLQGKQLDGQLDGQTLKTWKLMSKMQRLTLFV